eukprot:6012029-Alexandrium_andersonii.AAC.1
MKIAPATPCPHDKPPQPTCCECTLSEPHITHHLCHAGAPVHLIRLGASSHQLFFVAAILAEASH